MHIPYVYTFVEGSTGYEFSVWAESHAVDGLCVLGECVETGPPLNLPQSHRRCLYTPGQYQVLIGIVGSAPCGTPLDRVDFFTVGLEVMNSLIVLHAP
ncbi:hypothetical protein EGW08_020703, partial [Elysia chlorotica]